MSNLILASAYQDRLDSWKLALKDYVSITLTSDRLDLISDDIARIKPQLLLLDFDLLDMDSANALTNLQRLSKQTNIIVLGDSLSEDLEWKMFKLGVRGCSQNNIKPELIKQIVASVQQGELWIRRTVARRLIDDLGSKSSKNRAYQSSLQLLDKLTQREYDIAIRVGNGQSNKHIARECAITERTVKAHLSEIFNKLGIADRLHLALILSTDERLVRRAISR
jgi:DNA-binding NarL/FixJ family response regulator